MLNKKLGLIALLAGVAVSDIMAGNFNSYAVGDVLVCFRKGGNDMVVDAGAISTLTNTTPNQRIAITQYTGDQLAAVGTNGVSWSAFTWSGDNTLFVTRPRISPDTQTAPWPATFSSIQGGTVARMATIPPGALDQLTLLVYPVSTATAVVEEDSSSGNPNYTDGVSYHDALFGADGRPVQRHLRGQSGKHHVERLYHQRNFGTLRFLSDDTDQWLCAGKVAGLF